MEKDPLGIQESQEGLQKEFQGRIQRFGERCDSFLEGLNPDGEEDEEE